MAKSKPKRDPDGPAVTYLEYRMCRDQACRDCRTCGYYWASGERQGRRAEWPLDVSVPVPTLET